MVNKLNYIHSNGDLDCLQSVDFPALSKTKTRKELIRVLVSDYGCSEEYLRTVLACYPAELTQLMHGLEFDIQSSMMHREQFRKFGYRGFSYSFDPQIRLLWPKLKPHVNLAMGLMTRNNLYYPPKVRNMLKKYHPNHLRQKGDPSIGFVLGQITPLGWFVLIIQSDIMFNKSSVIRDHFRGWRKLLVTKLIEQARGKTEKIFLCPAEHVIETCKVKSKPEKLPQSWISLYDKTAEEFGMKRVLVPEGVNIQCFEREKDIRSNDFYALTI
ncbi:MAG: hypothetical protein HEP71_02905 [Roseivirga sp.]|nr:hypothetical protein [Roseivirga sp.]